MHTVWLRMVPSHKDNRESWPPSVLTDPSEAAWLKLLRYYKPGNDARKTWIVLASDIINDPSDQAFLRHGRCRVICQVDGKTETLPEAEFQRRISAQMNHSPAN